MSEQLVEIGARAVAFVTARAARMKARHECNSAAADFSEEYGGDARYSEDSEHPQGFSPAFLDATREQQEAYKVALAAEKSARQRLYAAVKKHIAAPTPEQR